MADAVQDYAVWIAALAAGVAGMAYLARLLIAVLRRVTVIQRLTESELEHNHGSSMKDDVHGMAVSLGKLQRKTDELDARLKRIERS